MYINRLTSNIVKNNKNIYLNIKSNLRFIKVYNIIFNKLYYITKILTIFDFKIYDLNNYAMKDNKFYSEIQQFIEYNISEST